MSTNLAYYAAANTAQQAEALDWPEKVGVFTGAAALSGLYSIANTGIDVLNYAGGDVDRLSTVDTLRSYDTRWANYYTQNQELIDTTGFVAGSILPGMLAVKGLKALQAGSSTSTFANVFRYNSVKQVEYLKAANESLVAGSTFSRWNANLLASIAHGTADTMLQTAVAEAAVIATMKANPLMDDKSYLELARDSAVNVLAFGGGFGVIGSAFANIGTFKKAAAAIDAATQKYTTAALGEKINLSVGDQAVKAFQELKDLPDSVWEADKILPFKFSVSGSHVEQTFDMGQRLEIAHKRTADKVFTNIRQIFTSSVEDTRVAGALADHMLDLVRTARNGGENALVANQAWKQVGDMFGGLQAADNLSAAGNTVKKFRPGVELPGDLPQIYLNTRTGATSLTARATAADLGDIEEMAAKLGITKKSATAFVDRGLTQEDSIAETARNYMLSKVTELKDAVIHETDFALLDRISELPDLQVGKNKLTLLTREFGEQPLEDFVGSSIKEFTLSKKVQYLQDAMSSGKRVDLELLARKMNVTEKWIEETIGNNFTKIEAGSTRELSSYGKVENIKLTYSKEVPQAWERPGSGWIDFNNRVTLAREQADRVAATTLGKHFSALLDIREGAIAKEANRTGAGAGLLWASDAGYAEQAKRAMQQSGIVVSKAAQEQVKLAHDSIASAATALFKNQKAVNETAAIVQRLRQTTASDGLVLHKLADGPVLIKESLAKMAAEAPEDFAAIVAQGHPENVIRIVHDETLDFLSRYDKWHKGYLNRHVPVVNATGRTTDRLNTNALYAPPVDTRKLNHFAFVRSPNGDAVSMISAKSAEDLANIAAKVSPDDGKVIFKRDTEAFFKAQGEYEFDRALNRSSVDSARARTGKLSQYVPNMRPEETIGEFLSFMERKETQLVRDAVELKYGQEFAQLRTLGDEATAAATSRMQFLPKVFQSQVAQNPYADFIKLGLNISPRNEYPLLSQMEEFTNGLGQRSYSLVRDAFEKVKGTKPADWEGANEAMARSGLPQVVTKELFDAAQYQRDGNLVRSFVRMSNTVLATTQLGFDFANSLVNIISTPIRLSAEMEAVKKLGAVLPTVTNPAGQQEISTAKLIGQAIRNYWDSSVASKLQRFEEIGAVHADLKFHRQLVEEIGSTASLKPNKMLEQFERVAELGTKLSGNKFAERFTRFVSADVMDQMVDPLVKAGKLTQAEADSFINVFVNRVQGNYHYSQRPVAFQGTVGSAVSLFQTYQFGMLQQLGRFMAEDNKKALFVAAGLQATTFGLNGLPGFDAINSYILGRYSNNTEHKDLYSTVGGNPLGDWLLYGSASALPILGGQGPALYSRGDIQPRHLTILPTGPTEVPSVQMWQKVYSTIGTLGSNLGNGAPVKESLLFALEHQGLNRPLAGLAQVAQGYSTTKDGRLIGAQHDLISLASASRILGARPMDEALAMQHMFRQKQYEAYDAKRIEDMGTAVKLRLRNNEVPTDEEYATLMQNYAAKGGNIQNFTKAINRWSKDANESVVNQMMEKHNKSSAKALISIMGGEPVEDLRNTSE